MSYLVSLGPDSQKVVSFYITNGLDVACGYVFQSSNKVWRSKTTVLQNKERTQQGLARGGKRERVNFCILSLSKQKWWVLPAFVLPMCKEQEALIELLLDKAETAYWANAPVCWNRSCNVTCKCVAGRCRGKKGTRRRDWTEEFGKTLVS